MSVADNIARIQAKFAAIDPAKPRVCRGCIQLQLTDQLWIMDLERLTLAEGKASDPDATFEMDDETFCELGAKTLSIVEARAAGRVRVSGNEALLVALQAGCCQSADN